MAAEAGFSLSYCVNEQSDRAVFRGSETKTNQTVVVKAGWPYVGSLPAELQRERDILMGPLSTCTGVPTILHTINTKDKWLLLVERPYGTTLDGYAEMMPPGPETLRDWARQAVQILKHIHRRDVLHRDIKPGTQSEQKLCCILPSTTLSSSREHHHQS